MYLTKQVAGSAQQRTETVRGELLESQHGENVARAKEEITEKRETIITDYSSHPYFV